MLAAVISALGGYGNVLLAGLAAAFGLLAGALHLKAKAARADAAAANDRADEAQAALSVAQRVDRARTDTEQAQREKQLHAPDDDGRTGLNNDWPG